MLNKTSFFKKVTLDKQMFINEGIGKVEQKYEILETLGQGGFGIVKKVRYRLNGDIRAMKII
jgi:serine/threonine protein kinase